MSLQQTVASGEDLPLAELTDIWKSYGGVPVLKGVSVDLMPGDIHALVGGNGAGKSTLMKILTGLVTPDSGDIKLAGQTLRRLSPRTAQSHGVYLVPQEPQLFPNLTVIENVRLAVADRKIDRAEVSRIVDELAHPIDLDQKASDLSISGQQLIEIVRGILRGANVLIVDEPTAALTAREAERLFDQLRSLTAKGVGVFYVSHRMPEIFALCNRVSVLRDGAIVLHGATADLSVSNLVTAMVPDALAHESAAKAEATVKTESPVLDLEGFTGNGFHDVSLALYKGEILGIAGVMGSGRTELAETVFGLRQGAGQMNLHSQEFNKRSPARCLSRGLSYVPEDRHEHGVFLGGSVTENISSTVLTAISRFGFIRTAEDRRLTGEMAHALALQPGAHSRAVGNLSGGNQQKISLAKALAPKPTVLFLDEPTRGIDIGARSDLYRLVDQLAQDGIAIVLISSDFEEIAALSTRVLIMCEGTITDELTGSKITLENVRNAAFGVLTQEAPL